MMTMTRFANDEYSAAFKRKMVIQKLLSYIFLRLFRF